MTTPSRRSFLKTAGSLATGVAASTVACAPETSRDVAPLPGLDRALLVAVARTTLPSALGDDGVQKAVDNFLAWARDYEPVAEEMHGYGYSDVRYLPADPVPAWSAQLAALNTLAQKMRGTSFDKLAGPAAQDVLRAALAGERAPRLPSPLDARHVVVALVAHWSATPAAWNLAFDAEVSPGSCRPLEGATRKPLPMAGGRA